MCHVDQGPLPNGRHEEDVKPLVNEDNVDRDYEEWQVHSLIFPLNSVTISDLDNLGRRDYDIYYNLQENFVLDEIVE